MGWREVLGGVGAVVGAVVGGPVGAIQGFSIGYSVGGVVEGPEKIKLKEEGYRLSDLSNIQSTSAYGYPIPKLFGRNRVSSQLIWSSGIKETLHTETSTVEQGKGGGVKTTTELTYYTYSVDAAFALGKGTVVGIRKIWADAQLIYNVAEDADTDTLAASLALAETFSFYTGSETQLANSLIQSYEGVNATPAFRGISYIVFSDFQLASYGNRIPQLSFEIVENGTISGDNIVPAKRSLSSTLIDIITDNTVLTEDDLDVSLLTDELIGYKIEDFSPAINSIMELLTVFMVDMIESDFKLKFIKRGNDAEVIILEDDLCAYEDTGNTEDLEPVIINRQKESELPKKVSITYFNSEKKYEVNEQHVNRLTVNTVKENNLSFPVVLSDTEAIQLAEKILYASWVGRTSYDFILSYEYLKLEPGSVIQIIVNSLTYNIRILSMEVGYPGLIKVSAVAEDKNAYVSNSVGISAEAVTETIIVESETISNFMDTPLIQDTDNSPGIYIAACGETVNWKGCVIYQSQDGGFNYSESGKISVPATMGMATTKLGSASSAVWDESNTVDIELYRGTLESKSEALVLNGNNLCLLGDELILFKNAELLSANNYRLSGLIRGWKGTEYAIPLHAIDERFVYLLPGTYFRAYLPLESVGIEYIYKVVSIGKSIADAIPFSFTNSAKGLRPLTPVHIKGERDIDGNITISWIRRNRLDGEWRDYIDVPMSETSEAYKVDINDNSWVDWKRTIEATTNSCIYTAAQQIADFGSTQSSVEITLYQWSQEVGYGFTTLATV